MFWEIVLVSIMLMGIAWTAVIWNVDVWIKAYAYPERKHRDKRDYQ